MKAETVKKIIDNISGINWVSLPDFDLSWVVVSKLPLGQHHLGLDTNGNWVTEGENGFIDISTGSAFETMVPLIKLPVSEFILHLRKSLVAANIPESVIKSFPFDEFLCYSAKRGGYWRELANKWLIQGYPLTYEIVLAFGDGDIHSKTVLNWKKQRVKQILDLE